MAARVRPGRLSLPCGERCQPETDPHAGDDECVACPAEAAPDPAVLCTCVCTAMDEAPCGTGAAATYRPAGQTCGTAPDGCGGTLQCGTCTAPQTCNETTGMCEGPAVATCSATACVQSTCPLGCVCAMKVSGGGVCIVNNVSSCGGLVACQTDADCDSGVCQTNSCCGFGVSICVPASNPCTI